MDKQNKFKNIEEWRKWNNESLNDEQIKNDIKKYKEQRAKRFGKRIGDYTEIVNNIKKKFPNFSKEINSTNLQCQSSTSGTKSKSPQM